MQNEPDMPIEPVEPKEPTDQYQPADPPVDPTTEPVEPTAQVPPLQSPTDPISPTEPSAQFQSVDTPDPAVQIPAQIDSASVGNRFINNKFIILFVLTLVVISLVGSGIWLSLKKDNDNGKLKANNYIATATSCAKVTELFKRTYSNSNIDMMSASSVGSTTSGANIQNSMAMSADTSSGSSKSAESSNDYSTTNVQVQGVDEADVVKNDGEYIYTITGGNIYIVKAYPPKDAKLTAKITLANNNSQDYYGDTGASEIFINKNRLMAIGSKSVTSKDLPNIKQGTSASSSASLSSTTESDLPPDYYDPAVNFTFIKVWDTTDKKSPKLVRSVEFEGDYSASRMIGDNVHIVLNGNPRIYDITSKTNGNELIPLYSDTQGSAKASYKPTCSCEQVEYFKNSEKIVEDYPNSYVNVISLSINNDKKAANRRTIVGNSDSVYASANNLYLASMTYGKVTDGEYNADTQLHKFNLKDDSSQYQTSANISGTLLNQYSMDEYKGNFRVAATKGSVTDTNTKSTNHIYVLDKDMKQIGSLDDLAPGEEIYSSRFVNDRVYLVTFKKVDPFFVIDLKDPTKPAVLGYLKIPGYSDYLHPYDENHIIGVGKEAIDASSQQISSRSLDFAWYQGLKMAIFDVTDVKAPKEMHKVVIGDRGTESPVLDDPKAFLFNKDKNLLVLPVSLYELTDAQKKSTKTTTNTYGKFTYQGAYVYNIDLTKGFTLKGRVTHASATPAKTLDHYDDSAYATEVRRTLYIGDNLYTISDSKIMANTLSNLDKTAEINLN